MRVASHLFVAAVAVTPETMEFMSVEFDGAGARAASFDVRAPNDMRMARGTRV